MSRFALNGKQCPAWEAVSLCSSAQWYSLSKLGNSLKNYQVKKPSLALELAIAICDQMEASSESLLQNSVLNEKAGMRLETKMYLGLGYHHYLLLKQYLILNNHSKASYHGNLFLHCLQLAVQSIGISWSRQQEDLIQGSSQKLTPRMLSQLSFRESVLSKRLTPCITFVLGMHRSGTSALAGMLCKAGFDAPNDLMPSTEANPKGYWESWSIHILNNKFLENMGSSWQDFHPFTLGWEDLQSTSLWRENLLNNIEDVFANSQHPIIKDPRFCILLPGLAPWLESNHVDFSFLLPLRHPFEVALSLEKREKVPSKDGIRLWLRYVFTSELASRGYQRYFFSFEQLLYEPAVVLDRCKIILKSSPIKDLAEDPSTFIDQELRHQRIKNILEEVSLVTSTISTERKLANLLYKILASNQADSNLVLDAIDELRKQWMLLL